MLILLDDLMAKYSMSVTGILHIGAHTGEEAEAYRRCGIDNVVWVEANPDLIPQLTANVQPYGHRVIQALVTDYDHGDCGFNVTNNMQSSSILEFGTHSKVSPDVIYIDRVTLQTRTVDSLAKEYDFSEVNMLNLDIQGAEGLALEGAKTLLSQIDYIYSEINVDELYLGCVQLPELDARLFRHGLRRVETAMAGNAGWGDSLYVRSST